MSAITKQIAAVEFHVNARQANAALESMRQSAEDAREEMSQLQEQANKGVKTVMVGGKDMDITKRIRDLNATAKAFEQAAQSQIKGVKAWDELWQHAKMGNIEQLTGQQIKAGVNGAKRQYDRLILGDEEDRRKAAAIRDIIDQADIVLAKLKGDTDKVIQTLSDGGHVADEVLKREKKNLEDMMSLTEKFSPEWQDYNRQLQAITKGIEEQAAQEKRLRGELVDANDARREAAKLDEDVARAAKEQHAAQQQKIDDAQKQMQQYQEQRRQHQEKAQKITDEIEKQDRQIASQSQLVESIKRENHERTKKSNVMVQEADQADKTADKAKRAADRSAKEVEKFSDKLQKAKDDVAALEEQLDKSSDNDKQATVIKLTKALDKQSKAEEDLKQKEKEAADAQEMYNRANADAVAKHEALDKAKAEGNKKLQEESRKLSQLQGTREASVASLNQEKEAIKQKNEAVDAQAKIINDAQQTQAKSRQLSIESIEKSIALLKQENRVIGDETNPQWVENEKTIGRLNQRLSEMKQHAAELRGEAMSVSQAMDISNIASGQRVREVEPVDSRVERATAKTRETLANIDGEIGRVNGDMEKLNAEMDKIGNRSTNLNPFVESLQQTNTLLHEQEERRKATADGFAKEAEQRQKAIAAQKEQVELLKNEKQSAVANIDQRIQAMQARVAELQGYEIKPKDYKQVIASVQDEIKRLEEEKAAIENSAETKQRFADANRKLAQLIKEDSEATASEKTALEKLDEQIANTQSEMKKLADSVPGFELDDIQHYAAELSKLNELLSKQKQERSDLGRTFMTEKTEREKAIQAQKDEIALMRRQKEEAISSINARIEAGRKMLETLNALPSEERTNGPAKGMLDSTHQTIRELYAQRDSIIKESDAKIEQATSKYTSLMKANEEATAKAEATLRKYDEQIYATQQQISEFAQKLSSVKGPVDAKALEESSKQMDELKNKLASLTAERQKYTDQLQRETEEATRLAEAEKTAAEAEQNSVSIEQMEKAISVLQQAQRTTTDNVDASRYSNAIDNLTQKLKEAKGEAVSLEEAMEMADVNSKQPYSIEEMQKGLKTLQEQQNTAIDPSQYTEAIGVLTQKIREAKGEAVSLEDALNFGKQGLAGSFTGTTEQLRQAKQVLESTLATTEKGEARYKEIREALAGIAVEEKRVGEVSAEVQKILDEPKGRSFNELKVAVEQGRKELNSMTRTTKEGQAAYDELAAKMKAADLELKNLGNESKGTQSSFEKAWSRLKTYITLYMGTAVAIQKLSGAMGDMMTLSDKMGEVRKTTGFTADQVGHLSDNLAKLDTRTPIQNLMDLSAAAGQLGLNTEEDVRGFTEAANEMMVALPELGQDGATQMMKVAIATGEVDKIRKQMQKGTIDGSSASAVAMEKIASTVDRLRATTAAAAPPITDFVKRVGAVGAQSGISIDQVAALGATVDELGMGTEMAGTALARMIPAIKQNAFGIAQAIGVKPETITQLYDTGHAMDVILMVLKHIKEENLNPDSVEKLLGTGGMADVVKQLNQQGARAGIVFAGLSQNVGELEKNLGTAKSAYESGTAIMDEYNKMNDTTAAKWERLKNQIQEVLVNNTAQSLLGWVIDRLRDIVNLLTGDSGISAFLRVIIGYFALTKINIGGIITGMVNWRKSLQEIGIALGLVEKESKAAASTNIWTALVAILIYVVYEVSSYISATREAYTALAKGREEVERAEDRFEGYWREIEKTNTALDKATAEHQRLSAEVDRLRQNNDKTSQSTALLTKKEGELKASENKVTKATNDRRSAIGRMNSIYGKYLGFLLTERNYALLAASAHDKISAAIEKEILLKQREASISAVESKYQQEYSDNYGKLAEQLANVGLTSNEVSRTMAHLQTWMKQNAYYKNGRMFINPNIYRQYNRARIDTKGLNASEMIALHLNDYLANTMHLRLSDRQRITGVALRKQGNGYSVYDTYRIGESSARSGFINTFVNKSIDEGNTAGLYNTDINNADNRETAASHKNATGLMADARRAISVIRNKKSSKAAVSQAYGDLGNVFSGLDNVIKDLDQGKDAKLISQIKSFASSLKKTKGIDTKRILKAQEKANESITDMATGGSGGDTSGGGKISTEKFDPGDQHNPWGSHPDASSTNWSKYNADELVNRRKQMNDFVRALQGDTDVQSVLSQDPALMKAVKSGKVKNDTDSVIEWYNKQRLEIQNVLHGRHLTNTGGWQDPKKSHQRAKSIAKQAKDDMAYYLDELDAYYTEQKSRIEDAQNDGQITEEEGWRRTLQNEQIWRQRRAELQQLYTDKNTKVTKEEMDAIYDIISDRTGDTTKFITENIRSTRGMIWKVGEKSLPAMRKIYGDLDKGVEQDFLKMRMAIKKQLDAIEEIVSKERPFDGIVKNLRQNITKMGLLFTDLDKQRMKLLKGGKDNGSEEMRVLNNKYAEQLPRRLTFLLQESENAYQMTWEKLETDMRKEGFGDWADAILKSGNAEKDKRAVIAQLHEVYDSVQDAIKKEASEVKKQVDIAWNDTTLPGNMSMKSLYEKTASALGIEQNSVSRANSLINAGQRSDRVADKLAIKQMEIQIQMQEHYYALVRKTGQQRIEDLERQAKAMEQQGDFAQSEQLRLDAKHAKMSLNLTLSEEETDLAKQRADLSAKVEESQNRLYTSLKEWGTLLSSSVQSVFEASNTGKADYYNNLAKMRLTGEGSAGGTYVIIDNAGTSKAKAHYESLDGEDALRRQMEIEQQNATADAWKKVMDDLNKKISDEITDWMNASMQTQAIDANTNQLMANTQALYETRPKTDGSNSGQNSFDATDPFSWLHLLNEWIGTPDSADYTDPERNGSGWAVDNQGQTLYPVEPYDDSGNAPRALNQRQNGWTDDLQPTWPGYDAVPNVSEDQTELAINQAQQTSDAQISASNASAEARMANEKKVQEATTKANKSNETGTHSAFAKMTQAANLYGAAYQIMSNQNMTAAQKWQMLAVQVAGQTAMTMLTTDLLQEKGKTMVMMPGILGKLFGEMPYPAAIATFAVITAMMGGLMALATSQVSKSKSQIAQATGTNVSAGRLSTGMLTYATGNVNEFTDPSTLTPGQQYNVDAADGHTYRARYMGANPKTHLTNGPEFHLVGERGREAIIDADTTRQLQMNDTGIWQAIQTLYNGGSIRSTRRRGMSNFASGNLDDFVSAASQGADASEQTPGMDMLVALQQSLDRNSEVMEKAVQNGIKGVFNVYGKNGLIDSYDTGKKNVNRHGERY